MYNYEVVTTFEPYFQTKDLIGISYCYSKEIYLLLIFAGHSTLEVPSSQTMGSAQAAQEREVAMVMVHNE